MDFKTMTVAILAVVMLGMVMTAPVACTVHRQRVIQEAITSGGDPIAVKCAIESENTGSTVCAIKASQGH